MEAAKDGGDRQQLHEVLREHTLASWPAVQAGESDPKRTLAARLAADPRITRWLPAETIPTLLDARAHVGDAPERARQFAAYARTTLARLVPGGATP
jgi:adenylosuccinate lyase